MSNALLGTTGGGAVFAALALLIRSKRHHWYKIRSILLFLAGLGLIVPIGLGMQWVIARIQSGGRYLSGLLAGNVDWLAGFINIMATGLPWVIGAVLTAWWVLDMWPKHGDPDDKTGFVGLLVPAAWMMLPPLTAMLQVG